ncbi:MAG: transcriptional repressor [Cyclobacteriaceae bacterium]
MNIEERKVILKNHKLRITNSRLDVIDHFLTMNKALSLGDLEHTFTEYDRVTLYRTLGSFLESGILHKIPNEEGSATYGLCHETCSPEDHTHNHVHFKCNQCGEIACLDGSSVPAVSLPEGYQVSTVNMIVDGLCKNCS